MSQGTYKRLRDVTKPCGRCKRVHGIRLIPARERAVLHGATVMRDEIDREVLRAVLDRYAR